MGTSTTPPPPVVPVDQDGDDRPRRPGPHIPVLLTAVAVDELLVAAHDRLGIVQDDERREHLWDAIHNLEAVVRDLGLADLTRQIAALEGYPTAPT